MASACPTRGTTYLKGIGPIDGGALIALDGTFPRRAIVRCLALGVHVLRSKGTNSVLMMPQSLYISHIFLSAACPSIVHQRPATIDAHQSMAESEEFDAQLVQREAFEPTTKWGAILPAPIWSCSPM